MSEENQAQTVESTKTIVASQLGDGDDWQAKYNGLQGVFKQTRERNAQEIEALKTSNADLSDQLEKAKATLVSNAEQLQSMATLQELTASQEAELKSAKTQLGRLSLITKHRLYDEDLTKLVTASNLPEDELDSILSNLSARTAQEQTVAIAKAAEGSVTSSSLPNASSSQDEIKALEEQAQKAAREGRFDGSDGFWAINTRVVQAKERLKKES